MSKRQRKWPALLYLVVTLLAFLTGEILLFLARRTQLPIALILAALDLTSLAMLLFISFPLPFPRQVYSVFRAADMWERKHIWKKEGPSEKYPAEPPPASLRNIRLAGLMPLVLVLGIDTYVWYIY